MTLHDEVKQAQDECRQLLTAQGNPWPDYRMDSSSFYGQLPEIQAAHIIAGAIREQTRAVERNRSTKDESSSNKINGTTVSALLVVGAVIGWVAHAVALAQVVR